MVLRRRVHAALQPSGFVGVAGLAIHLGDVVGMRILLDVGVAAVAPKGAVNACAELISVDGDAVARRILHGLVAVAGQAFSLREERTRLRANGKYQREDKDCTGRMSRLESARQRFVEANQNCDKERCDSRGLSSCCRLLSPRHVT